MRCKDFEERISDYLDEELSREETRRFERHMLTCPTCGKTLSGVLQVRQALSRFGASRSPASFKLRLSNCLQKEIARKRDAWIRPLVFGAALVAALAILLWPDQDEQLAAYWQRGGQESQALDWVPSARRQPGSAWIGRFPELSRPGSHSHAQVRTVSY